MNRRGFLSSILAAGVAPYVQTTAGVLMPVKKLWTPVGRDLGLSQTDVYRWFSLTQVDIASKAGWKLASYPKYTTMNASIGFGHEVCLMKISNGL